MIVWYQGDDDDDGEVMGGDFDFTAGDGLSQEDVPCSQDVPSQDDLNVSVFRGDNMVSQPQMVSSFSFTVPLSVT